MKSRCTSEEYTFFHLAIIPQHSWGKVDQTLKKQLLWLRVEKCAQRSDRMENVLG